MGSTKTIRELRRAKQENSAKLNDLTLNLANTEESRSLQNTEKEVLYYKPLLIDFFTCAYNITKQFTDQVQVTESLEMQQHQEREQCEYHNNNNENLDNTSKESHDVRERENDEQTSKASSITTTTTTQRVKYKFEPFALCPLTPSCNVASEFRYYEQDGHFNESESLFKKHATESKYLLHVLPIIIENLLEAHRVYAEVTWEREHHHHHHYHHQKEEQELKLNVNGEYKSNNIVQNMNMNLNEDVFHVTNTDNKNNCCSNTNDADNDDEVLQGSVVYSTQQQTQERLVTMEENNDSVNCSEQYVSQVPTSSSSSTNNVSNTHRTRRFHVIESVNSEEETEESVNFSITKNVHDNTHINNDENGKRNETTMLLNAQSMIENLSDVVITLSPILHEENNHCNSDTDVNFTTLNEHEQQEEEEVEVEEKMCASTSNNNNNNNNNNKSEEDEFEGFYTEVEPDISVYDFMKRMILYTNVSPASVIIGCIYMDRLLCEYKSLLLNKLNVYMLLMTAIRVASKAYDIRIVGTLDFAKAVNVDEKDLVELEQELMERLHFNLYVAAEEFYGYAFHLIEAAAGNARERRNEQMSVTSVHHQVEQQEEQQQQRQQMENEHFFWSHSHRPHIHLTMNKDTQAKVPSLTMTLPEFVPQPCNTQTQTCLTQQRPLCISQTFSILQSSVQLLPPQKPAPIFVSETSLSAINRSLQSTSFALNDVNKSFESNTVNFSNGLSNSTMLSAPKVSLASTEMSTSELYYNDIYKINVNANNNIVGVDHKNDHAHTLLHAVIAQYAANQNTKHTLNKKSTCYLHSLHADALLLSQPRFYKLRKDKSHSVLRNLEIVEMYIPVFDSNNVSETEKEETSVLAEQSPLYKTSNKAIKQNYNRRASVSLSASTLRTTRPPSQEHENNTNTNNDVHNSITTKEEKKDAQKQEGHHQKAELSNVQSEANNIEVSTLVPVNNSSQNIKEKEKKHAVLEQVRNSQSLIFPVHNSATSLMYDKRTLEQIKEKNKLVNSHGKLGEIRHLRNLHLKQYEQNLEMAKARRNHLPPLATYTKPPHLLEQS